MLRTVTCGYEQSFRGFRKRIHGEVPTHFAHWRYGVRP